ncbi:MAG: hypothetical protein DME99_01055, partial [Verrucomicrobia bacterium]
STPRRATGRFLICEYRFFEAANFFRQTPNQLCGNSSLLYSLPGLCNHFSQNFSEFYAKRCGAPAGTRIG